MSKTDVMTLVRIVKSACYWWLTHFVAFSFFSFFFVGFVCILFEGLVFLWGKILGLACSSVGEGVLCVPANRRERERHTHMELWVVFWGEQKKDGHAGSW
jgi:hypothetical protein